MAVLNAFAEAKRPLTMAELDRLTGCGRSAIQRIVYTLKSLGYLNQLTQSKQYVLSTRMFEFAHVYSHPGSLFRLAEPILEELNLTSGETVNLTVLDGQEVVYVLRYVTHHVVSVNLQIGSRLPAYCTAPGRAMLAHLPKSEVQMIFDQSILTQRTPHTIIDPAALLAKLEETIENGYAVNDQEAFVGDISVAAPVLSDTGRPVAAVNIAVPYPRWTAEDANEKLAPLILAAASQLSALLGFVNA